MTKLLSLVFTVPSSLHCVNGTIRIEQNSGNHAGMNGQIRRLPEKQGFGFFGRARDRMR